MKEKQKDLSLIERVVRSITTTTHINAMQSQGNNLLLLCTSILHAFMDLWQDLEDPQIFWTRCQFSQLTWQNLLLVAKVGWLRGCGFVARSRLTKLVACCIPQEKWIIFLPKSSLGNKGKVVTLTQFCCIFPWTCVGYLLAPNRNLHSEYWSQS